MYLDQSRINQLKSIVEQQKSNPSLDLRTEYYTLLSDYDMPYGDLALGVVRNNTFSGEVANYFLDSSGISENQKINLSIDLMLLDFEMRLALFEEAKAEGLAKVYGDLSVDTQREIHSKIFSKYGIDIKYWTPEIIIRVFGSEEAQQFLNNSGFVAEKFILLIKSASYEQLGNGEFLRWLGKSVAATLNAYELEAHSLIIALARRNLVAALAALTVLQGIQILDSLLPYCFTAETPILMSDGTYKPIAEIQIGDEVMAFEGLGELQPRQVTQTFITLNQKVVQLGNIKVTLGHHFLQSDGSFKALKEIDTNGFLVGVTGKCIPHPGLQPVPGKHTVYNFTVEGLHTYIAGGIRVHNTSIRDHILPGSEIKLAYQLPDGTQVAFAKSPNSEYITYIVKDTDRDGNTNLLRTIANFEDRETRVIRDEIYDGQGNLVARDFDIQFVAGTDIGQQIGTTFGSSLGQAIAGDDIFAQIATGSVLSTVLGNIGDSLHLYFRDTLQGYRPGDSTLTFLESVEAGFDSFAQDLFDNIKSAGISAVSSFLTAELSDVFDIPGDFGGQLLQSSIGNVTSTLVGNVAEYVAKGATGTLDLFNGFEATNIITNVGSFIGGYLARQIVEPETTAGAIGGSIGGALGTTIVGLTAVQSFLSSIGTSILATLGFSTATITFLGSIGNFILPGIGAFAGVILGTVLGDEFGGILDDWFGQDPPRADAWLNYDPSLGKFISDPTGEQQEGGQRKAAVEIAGIAKDVLNAYIERIDGEIINQDSLKESFSIWQDEKYQKKPFRFDNIHFKTAQEQLEYGVLTQLRRLQIAGGDLYAKRVIQNSQAKTIEELSGDLQIAQDYRLYLENKDVIDLLIAIEPNSAFAASWVITLIRAQELKLTEWSASDFQGGLAGFFDSIGLDKIGATPDDVAISINGTTLKLEIVVDSKVVNTIEIEDFAKKINYQQLAASANGSVVTGTTGNDIWIAGNTSSTFVDGGTATNNSNDILIGSNFADTINGGQGRDFIRGNGGNDLLIGSSNNDLVYGGDGNDTIHGDENNGFAPIPTGVELSSAAESNAAIAFDSVRRTWFGGVESAEIKLSRKYTPPAPDFNEDEVHGGAGNDQIAGGAGEDKLYGDAGADTLYGDAGNDLLNGGNGADILYGGAGYDAASYASATVGVTVDLAGGTFKGTTSDGDQLYSIEDIIGSTFNDTLKGDAYANLIDGGMGNDTLDGRGGRDAVSFFSSTHAVKIDLGTDLAVTKTGEKTTQTDTLLNIEDAIASTHNDTLIGSTLGGGLDGSSGNDTIIIANDDVDVAGGAAAYDVRGGEGFDNLSFANWNKSRGVKIDLKGNANGNKFSGIEKVIGSKLADSITGSDEAEIFDGGTGDDVFTASNGRDVYLLNRGSGNEQLSQTVIQDDSISYGTLPIEFNESFADWLRRKDDLNKGLTQQQSLVFGKEITYHDIFGSLSGINPNSIDLSSERYFVKSQLSIITRQQLLDQLNSIDLAIGIKAKNSYINNTEGVLSKLTDTITIQGGGLLPIKKGNIASDQGTEYNFGTNQPIERLGFADSGYIGLGDVKYFKDGSASVDTLVADKDKATWLYGGDLGDIIKGANKADVLVGGQNNDLLQGNEGDDQYAYWLGDGHDIITDLFGKDAVVFGGGIGTEQIKLKIGKLDNPSVPTSFRDLNEAEFQGDLKIEVYNPQTNAFSGSIAIVDFQSNLNAQDRLRFAGDVEYTFAELLKTQGITILPRYVGGAGNDTLKGGDEAEEFVGLSGNDTMRGGNGDDVFFGHLGADWIVGDEGLDTVDYEFATGPIAINLSNSRATEPGNVTDVLSSIENALGSDFNDTITGGNDNNNNIILSGRDGNDVINGSDGKDKLFGGQGDDQLSGGNQDDLMDGDRGNDTIGGWVGNDTLIGGLGNDALTGGTGKDRFTFNSPTEGVDQISDFSVVDDAIAVSAISFGGLTANAAITSAQFKIGTGATNSSERFIYNDANGALLFDQDGSGSTAQVQIATLSTGLAMTNANIFVLV